MHELLRKPLKLGSLILPSPLIQAPLAGYSLAPFRRLIQQHSGKHLTYTEMLSPFHVLRKRNQMDPHVVRDPSESFLGYQLGGCHPQMLAQVIQAIQIYQPDTIDLNCGCPQRKIRQKGWGSSLLDNPSRLQAILKTLRKTTDIPLSIKIRLHPKAFQQQNRDILSLAEDEGCDFIIIHGRHWSERYETRCRYDQVADLCQRSQIPVIVNGDIADITSLSQWVKHCAPQGFMIGRAGLGNPWLFKQLKEPQMTPPSIDTVYQTMSSHLLGLCEYYHPINAMNKFRGTLCGYFHYLPEAIQHAWEQKKTEAMDGPTFLQWLQSSIATLPQPSRIMLGKDSVQSTTVETS